MSDPKTVSIEELLAVASEIPKPKRKNESLKKRELEAVREYVRKYKIVADTQAVPLDIVYQHYQTHTKYPISRRRFSAMLSEYLPKKFSGRLGGVMFYINPESIGLPTEYTAYNDPIYYVRHGDLPTNYLGVYLSMHKKIVVRIKYPDGYFHAPNKTFATAEAAAEIYDKLMIELYGNDAVVNFPDRWKGLKTHGRPQKDKD